MGNFQSRGRHHSQQRSLFLLWVALHHHLGYRRVLGIPGIQRQVCGDPGCHELRKESRLGIKFPELSQDPRRRVFLFPYCCRIINITQTLEESMDAAKSFSFPFEDPDWLSKLGLGALISMIPILNFAWTGYLVDIIRSVMNNDGDVLSTWDDLGKKFNEGLILFGAWIVYASPILI